MKAKEQIERLERMNRLIKAEHTGNPQQFASQLRICKSHLFNLIEEMKIMGAPIKYSRIRMTYYYDRDYEIML
jgi:hypothetical protein